MSFLTLVARFAILGTAGVAMLFIHGVVFFGLLVHGVHRVPAADASTWCVVLVVEALYAAAMVRGAVDLIRIGLLPGIDPFRQAISTATAWLLPVVTFCATLACTDDAPTAIAAQLATVLLVTLAAELSNLASDRTLIPSPGRCLAALLESVMRPHNSLPRR